MIKINLLESSKGKNRRGGGGSPAMPTMEMGNMGSPKLKVLLVVVIAGAVNFSYWYRLDTQAKSPLRCKYNPPSKKIVNSAM